MTTEESSFHFFTLWLTLEACFQPSFLQLWEVSSIFPQQMASCHKIHFLKPLTIAEKVQCFGYDCYALAFGIPAALMVVATGKSTQNDLILIYFCENFNLIFLQCFFFLEQSGTSEIHLLIGFSLKHLLALW